jgi:hypothetical protein
MEKKRQVGTKFAGVLAFISIYGFLEIILDGTLDYSILEYSNTVWLVIMGVGFLFVARPIKLYRESKNNISENSFSRMVTLIIGLISIIAGILSLPEINIVHQSLKLVKAIVSVIAILFIVLQTWIFEH